jgi:putative two-component system response regulator
MTTGDRDPLRIEEQPRLPLPSGVAMLWNEAIEHLSSAATILIGGAEETLPALSAILSRDHYHLRFARDGAEIAGLAEDGEVDLFILHAALPDSLASCHRAKRDPRTRLIPILMLLDPSEPAGQALAWEAGADEILMMPYEDSVVRSRVRSMLRHKNAIDQLEEAETILFALAQAIEKKDQAFGGHCARLATFSVALGMSLGLPRAHLLALYRGGFLHDIGKVAVPDSILFKPTRLEAAEWEVMKTHTTKGEEICRSLRSLTPVLPIIRSHHERWDGSGYPDGLRGAQIPLLARILQLADVYDALTSERPYKPAMTAAEALETMRTETTRGWRDPELMKAFQELHHGRVLRSAHEETADWRGVDSVRASLLNLGRRVSTDRGVTPDQRRPLFDILPEVAPVFNAG